MPETLGRYRIEAEIGRGMMGIVYKATDPVLERSVALKIVRPALPLQEPDRLLLEQRFVREASLAAGLSHPNIVVVHDVGCDSPTQIPFIALEYLEGRTLEKLLAEGPALSWREALCIAVSLADALQHAHGRGIVHRDVKPSNIMVLPSGQPKILDFGIARAAAAEFTGGREFWGSPAYMSPEQAAGYAVDNRTDLFSLGAVLYELLAGRRAFEGEGVAQIVYRVVNDDPPVLSLARPGLPQALDGVLVRALAKDPEARYRDGRAFAEALQAVLRSEELISTASRKVLGALPSRRSRLTFGAAVVLMLTAVPFSRSGGATSPADAVRVASPSPIDSTGLLALSVEHSQKQGRLRVWVEDELALDRALVATQTRQLLFLKRSTGRVATVISVPAGQRSLRIEVSGESGTRSKNLRGVFRSGEPRTLRIKVGGAIETEWVS